MESLDKEKLSSWVDVCGNCCETRRLWKDPTTGMHLCSSCRSNPETMCALVKMIEAGLLPFTGGLVKHDPEKAKRYWDTRPSAPINPLKKI